MKLFSDKKTQNLSQEISRLTRHIKEAQEEILRMAKERELLLEKVIVKDMLLESLNSDIQKANTKHEEELLALSKLQNETKHLLKITTEALEVTQEKLKNYKAIVDGTQTQEYASFLISDYSDRVEVHRMLNEKLSMGYTVDSMSSSSIWGKDNILHVILSPPRVKPPLNPD